MAYDKKQKLSENIEAIRIAFDIERTSRKPSESDIEVLRKFNGFGGLKFLLYPEGFVWPKADLPYRQQTQELLDLLRDNSVDNAEYMRYVQSIKNSILTGFYTPAPQVKAIAEIFKANGIDVKNFLDPSSGKGVFIDYFKENYPLINVTAYEKDLITGKVLSALHSDSEINVKGYETIDKSKEGTYDVVASNIPFGNTAIFDPEYSNSTDSSRRNAVKAIHNYFFMKSLDQLKNGGVLAFLTSRGVLDSPSNEDVRRAMVLQADVVSVIRLPEKMFREESGTDIGCDLIILQKNKHKQELSERDNRFVESKSMVSLTYGRDGHIFVNSLFSYPDPSLELKYDRIVQSEVKIATDAYGKPALNYLYDGNAESIAQKMSSMLQEDFSRYFSISLYKSQDIIQPHGGPVKNIQNVQLSLFDVWDDAVSVPESTKINIDPRPFTGEMLSHYRDGLFIVDDNQLGILSGLNSNSPIFTPKEVNELTDLRLRMYIPIRDTYESLFRSEATEKHEFPGIRRSLNQHYDDFVRRFGYLNARMNSRILSMDIMGRDTLTLEYTNDEGKTYKKADIFDRPVSFKVSSEIHAENPADALVYSLNEYGTVDFEYMSSISDFTGEELRQALKDRIFYNPLSDSYEIADKFLAGNVVKKIRDIKDYLSYQVNSDPDGDIQRSLSALESIKPTPIPFEELDFNFGERWMPTEYFSQFASKFFEADISIGYAPRLDEFFVKCNDSIYGNVKISEEYAISSEFSDYNGIDLLRHALYNTVPNIWKCVGYKPNGDPVKALSHENMQIFASKIETIRNAFNDWVRDHDTDWKQSLADQYNSRFNCFVRAKYDGSHQTFPGINLKGLTSSKFKINDIYQSQKDCVWMLLQNGGGICDHEVGTGKTLIMCMTAHEMKRLGMVHKPIIIGMKANVAEIAITYQTAYPNDRILYASQKDFSDRQTFFNRMKNNDYDCVIMSHDQFTLIPQSLEIQKKVMMEEMYALDEALSVAQANGTSITGRMLSGLEKRKENLEAKLNDINYKLRKRSDDVVDFQTMGIDHIFVDESQVFKNLAFTTRDQRVAGLGDPSGSQRARNLEYAIRTIQDRTGKDLGATFLSGTTISNSLTELYILFKYLRPQALSEQNINSFDAWAAVFAQKTRDYEIGVAGSIAMKERYRHFIKVPELAAFYNEITDYRTADLVGLDRPDMSVSLVNIEPTGDQSDFQQRLVQFAQNGDGELVFRPNLSDSEQKAKMLLVTGMGKKCSLSPKLVNPDYSESDETKIGVAAKNISEYYYKYNEQKGTQFVFCDLSTPKKEDWSAYQELKDRLVNHYGIPVNEIAFIQDAGTERKKAEFIKKMNQGEIRIMFGSTTMLGTGVNAQEKAVAVHHLDLPWRPSDLEQRNGRARRKGNEVAKLYANNNVDVLVYAVNHSLDSYNFYLLQAKSEFIHQLKQGTLGKRSFDQGSDDEENGMPFAEFVAITSGNNDLLERAKLEKRILALESERKSFLAEQYRISVRLDSTRKHLESDKANLEKFKEDFTQLESIAKKDRDGHYLNDLVIGNAVTEEEKGALLQKLFTKKVSEETRIGTIYGFPIVLKPHANFGNDKDVNDCYVKGKELYYSYNNGHVNLSSHKAASEYALNALIRIPLLIDQYEKRISQMTSSIPDLEKLSARSWEKSQMLAELKEQVHVLDKKIQQDMEIAGNRVNEEERPPFTIEKTWGRSPWKLKFSLNDYPFLTQSDFRNVGEMYRGVIHAYADTVNGEFKHQYGAEEAMKELSKLNLAHQKDLDWLTQEAQDFYSVSFTACAKQLRSLGYNRDGKPLSALPETNHLHVIALANYGDIRDLAHGVKDHNLLAENTAIAALTQVISGLPEAKNAVLIPMPGHNRYSTSYWKDKVSQISKRTDIPMVEYLKSPDRSSVYEWKKVHPEEPVPDIIFAKTSSYDFAGKTPILIDNVLDTGATASAALDIVPERSLLIVLGMTGNHERNHGKDIDVTVVENGLDIINQHKPTGVGYTGMTQKEIADLVDLAHNFKDYWGANQRTRLSQRQLRNSGIDWNTGQPEYLVSHILSKWDATANLENKFIEFLDRYDSESLFTEEEIVLLGKDYDQFHLFVKESSAMFKDERYLMVDQYKCCFIMYDYLREKIDNIKDLNRYNTYNPDAVNENISLEKTTEKNNQTMYQIAKNEPNVSVETDAQHRTTEFVYRILASIPGVKVVMEDGRSPQEGSMPLRKSDGTIYGWTIGNEIHLTPEGMNVNTQIHEYTHLWATALQQNNSALWDEIKTKIKDTPIWKEVEDDGNYSSLVGEDMIASEVLARMSGRHGAHVMQSLYEVSFVHNFITALKEFWNWVGENVFGIKSKNSINDIREVSDRVLYDFINKTDLGLKPMAAQQSCINILDYMYQNGNEEVRRIIDNARKEHSLLKAPDGSETRLTPVQWVYVRTERFQKFYGNNSQMLDESHEPVLLYHGTMHHNFETFINEGRGIYFTPQREAAMTYGGNDATPYQVFVRMDSPSIVDFEGEIDTEGNEYHGTLEQEYFDAIENGNDGVIALDTYDGENLMDQYVVHKPDNIMLADDIHLMKDLGMEISQDELNAIEQGQAVRLQKLQKTPDLVYTSTDVDYFIYQEEDLPARYTVDFGIGRDLTQIVSKDELREMSVSRGGLLFVHPHQNNHVIGYDFESYDEAELFAQDVQTSAAQHIRARQRKLDESIRNLLIEKMQNAGINIITDVREGQRVLSEYDPTIRNRHSTEVRYFKTSDGSNVYGFVKNGAIYIDPKIATAETPIHEYAHLWVAAVRERYPEEWRDIVDTLKQAPNLWEKVKREYPELKSDDDIADEVLAQYSGHRGYQQLLSDAQQSSDPKNFIEKIAVALTKLWSLVADMLQIEKGKTEEYKIPTSDKEQLADWILKDLLTGVNPQNLSAGMSDNAIQLQKDMEQAEILANNERFNRELEQQVAGTLPVGHIYNLGKPGSILQSAGFPNDDIELSATHLKEKSLQDNHPYDISDVRDLVKAINDPLAVFVYGKINKSQNVVAEIERDGKKFVVGVHFNQERGVCRVSSIRGLYNKDNAEWLNWISQGKLLYANKEKIQDLIAKQQTNLADVNYLDLNFVTKIVENFENPKFIDEKDEEIIRFHKVSTSEKKIASSFDVGNTEGQLQAERVLIESNNSLSAANQLLNQAKRHSITTKMFSDQVSVYSNVEDKRSYRRGFIEGIKETIERHNQELDNIRKRDYEKLPVYLKNVNEVDWTGQLNVYSSSPFLPVSHLSHAVKTHDEKAIRTASDILTVLVRRVPNYTDAVLVPVPNSSGKAEYTLDLANAISKNTGLSVADVLEGQAHIALHKDKVANGSDLLKLIMYDLKGELPNKKSVILVDNVLDTGTTAMSAMRTLGNNASLVVLGNTVNYKKYNYPITVSQSPTPTVNFSVKQADFIKDCLRFHFNQHLAFGKDVSKATSIIDNANIRSWSDLRQTAYQLSRMVYAAPVASSFATDHSDLIYKAVLARRLSSDVLKIFESSGALEFDCNYKDWSGDKFRASLYPDVKEDHTLPLGVLPEDYMSGIRIEHGEETILIHAIANDDYNRMVKKIVITANAEIIRKSLSKDNQEPKIMSLSRMVASETKDGNSYNFSSFKVSFTPEYTIQLATHPKDLTNGQCVDFNDIDIDHQIELMEIILDTLKLSKSNALDYKDYLIENYQLMNEKELRDSVIEQNRKRTLYNVLKGELESFQTIHGKDVNAVSRITPLVESTQFGTNLDWSTNQDKLKDLSQDIVSEVLFNKGYTDETLSEDDRHQITENVSRIFDEYLKRDAETRLAGDIYYRSDAVTVKDNQYEIGDIIYRIPDVQNNISISNTNVTLDETYSICALAQDKFNEVVDKIVSTLKEIDHARFQDLVPEDYHILPSQEKNSLSKEDEESVSASQANAEPVKEGESSGNEKRQLQDRWANLDYTAYRMKEGDVLEQASVYKRRPDSPVDPNKHAIAATINGKMYRKTMYYNDVSAFFEKNSSGERTHRVTAEMLAKKYFGEYVPKAEREQTKQNMQSANNKPNIELVCSYDIPVYAVPYFQNGSDGLEGLSDQDVNNILEFEKTLPKQHILNFPDDIDAAKAFCVSPAFGEATEAIKMDVYQTIKNLSDSEKVKNYHFEYMNDGVNNTIDLPLPNDSEAEKMRKNLQAAGYTDVVYKQVEPQKAQSNEQEEVEKQEENKTVEDKKADVNQVRATILIQALLSAAEHKESSPVWLNAKSKSAPEIYKSDETISPFNSLVMAAHSDQKGYKTNVFTTFYEGKNNGLYVRAKQSSIPFTRLNFSYYVNKYDKSDVIDRDTYDKLPEQEKELYVSAPKRQLYNIFNVDQTTMYKSKPEEYKSLVESMVEKTIKDDPDRETKVQEQFLQQYTDLKEKYPDVLHLFRCGDSYEAYKDDAETASKILDLTLTSSTKIKDEQGKPIAIVRFPYNALDTILPKLVRAGQRIAICDQLLKPQFVGEEVKIYGKLDNLIDELKKNDESVELTHIGNSSMFDGEHLTINNARFVEPGKEFSLATERANDTYRAVVAYIGAPPRLNRVASGNVVPKDSVKYDKLVQELAAGVMVMRMGVPARISEENIKLIPYWERELRESPKLINRLERDVDNAVKVIDMIANGKVNDIDYQKMRGEKSSSVSKIQVYSIVTEINQLPDLKDRKLVLIKDKTNGSVDVILPEGASLQPGDETKGMSKNRILIALKKDGYDPENVKFYNAGGDLGLKMSNEYFVDKEIEVSKLKQYALITETRIDVTEEIKQSSQVQLEAVEAIRDDDGYWQMYVRPNKEYGEAFTCKAEQNDIKLLYDSIGKESYPTTIQELGQKYYNLVLQHPDRKTDFLMPKVSIDNVKERITHISITKDKDNDNSTILIATIDGKKYSPREISKEQYNRFFLVPDKEEYKTALASVLFEKELKSVSVTSASEVKSQQDQEESTQEVNQQKEENMRSNVFHR